MFKDKNGNEVTIGDHILCDEIEYIIVSEGKCLDMPDEDSVLYGQQVEDMRISSPFSVETMTRWEKKGE